MSCRKEITIKNYILPDLPYAYDALKPYIGTETMKFHHDFHHKGYVTKLNAALAKYPKIADKLNLYELITKLDTLPQDIRSAVRNNGGGHINHSMFWEIMCPHTSEQNNINSAPEFSAQINKDFDSFEKFYTEFSECANSLFGSGWAWLIYNPTTNKLKVMKTFGHDNPMMLDLVPLLVIDVWEHAYYLDYQNRRPDFVKAFKELINWKHVNELYKNTQK